MDDFVVIGEGTIGEKASQLYRKKDLAREIGFRIPPTIVFAEQFFDDFFQKNNLGRTLRDVKRTDDLEERIRNGELTQQQMDQIASCGQSLGTVLVTERSSAEGDARGTGTYTSKISRNNPLSIARNIRGVLASYFSEDAVAFRRDAQTGEGFAVMLQPLVGQPLKRECFGPLYSGLGYSSTVRGGAYIKIVPGLFGGVSSRDVVRIIDKSIRNPKKSLILFLIDEMFYDEELQKQDAMNKLILYPSGIFYSEDEQKYNSLKCLLDEEAFHTVVKHVSLNDIFSSMASIERRLEIPQYVEWAVTIENGKPQWWLLQIADVHPKMDAVGFGDENIVLECQEVTGTGVKEAYKIVTCQSSDDASRVAQFNKENKNYVLMYSSRMTTDLNSRRLRYEDVSNASVFIEKVDGAHASSPISHWQGQLERTGKFLGVLDYHGANPPNWEKLEARKIEELGLEVYDHHVTVTASEKQDRMQVTLRTDCC